MKISEIRAQSRRDALRRGAGRDVRIETRNSKINKIKSENKTWNFARKHIKTRKMAEMATFRKAEKLGRRNCSELGVGKKMAPPKGQRGNCRDRSETQNSKTDKAKKRKIKQGILLKT